MDKVRTGIIGAGKMGILHTCLFNKIPGSSLVAICDTAPLNLRLLRSALPKATMYDDFNHMLESAELDLVVVTTPVFLHHRMAMTALKKGIAVFMEKPLALNGDQSLELAVASEKTTTCVGYCRRFMATYQMAKSMLEIEQLGKVKSFSSHMFVTQNIDESTGWQYDPKKSGGGVLMDLGSHAFDMVHYLLGDVQYVSATALATMPSGVETSTHVDLELRNGLSGSLDVSWSEPGFRLPEMMMDIRTEFGRIRVCEKYIEVIDDRETVPEKRERTIYKQHIEKGVHINIGGPEYTREDMHIIDSILKNTPTICDFTEAAKTNYVIEAGYSSIKKASDRVAPRSI
ncbi:MAG TPA: Gfo/Idh/MocA family oxidoreductase [Methanomassiliicoccales archaeon]|nr:Gfo/Idh/MocA family oxidoreductase [Methanomassiliicoccales archaeon]